MKRARSETMRDVHKRRYFWIVARDFEKREDVWLTTASYEVRRKLTVGAKVWTACYQVNVLAEPDDAGQKCAGVRFESTVTIWAPKVLTARDKQVLLRMGWYRGLPRILRARGYRGGWKRWDEGR